MNDQSNDLDSFLSSAGIEAEQPQEITPQAEPAAQPQTTEERQRDEQGRFAPKAGDPPPSEPLAQPDAQQPTTEPAPGAMVPLAAVHAERRKNDDLQRQLQQLTGQVQALMARPSAPAPTPATPQAKKEIWDDPESYIAEANKPILDQVRQNKLDTSMMLAVDRHGEATVQTAYQALGEALQTDPRAKFEYERIMASRHPYDELVSWHKQHQTLQKIGADPDAYVQSEIERRLSDPAEQAKILERIRGAANTTGQTTRQAPLTQLPPTLSRIPTGGNDPGTADMSSEGLFAHATARR